MNVRHVPADHRRREQLAEVPVVSATASRARLADVGRVREDHQPLWR